VLVFGHAAGIGVHLGGVSLEDRGEQLLKV
jgi:hypothetical protein